MSKGTHTYTVRVVWDGNRGRGTADYRAYGREHTISAGGKPNIPGSSDPAFRGNAERWNPEDLLVAAASACHKLWYLHLCADAGIAVQGYEDEAIGTMVEDAQGGRFTRIVLQPRVRIRAGDDAEIAARLHHLAHARCYIANSVNFPIECAPVIESAPA